MKIVNFAHFFQNKRSVLDLNAEPPTISNGYPKDGSIMLSISDEKGERKAFKLSIEETSRLMISLDNYLRNHENTISKLWETKK